MRTGKVTVLGAAPGLVAVTPASGFVGPMPALMIGPLAGVVCYGAVIINGRFGYDDSLDVLGVHAVGGTLGALLTGVFATRYWAGNSGLLEGNIDQFLVQVYSVVATAVTWVILKLLDVTIGLRVSETDEREGLDTTQHGESSYNLG